MPAFNTVQLRNLDRRLARVGKIFDAKLMGRTLRDAAKPLLDISRREVPVGQRKFKSARTRTTKAGKVKRDRTYDQGGATKRSLRIRLVPGVGSETVRVLVGVSKSKGKAGWRTHLITRKNKNRQNPNDFLGRAEAQGVPLVISGVSASALKIVNKELG